MKDATTDAMALIARAVAGDLAGLWSLADDVVMGDTTRATIVELAGAAGSALREMANMHGLPVSVLVDDLAGGVAEQLTEGEE